MNRLERTERMHGMACNASALCGRVKIKMGIIFLSERKIKKFEEKKLERLKFK